MVKCDAKHLFAVPTGSLFASLGGKLSANWRIATEPGFDPSDSKRKSPETNRDFSFAVPTGVEPVISWMKTRRPRPLDDGTLFFPVYLHKLAITFMADLRSGPRPFCEGSPSECKCRIHCSASGLISRCFATRHRRRDQFPNFTRKITLLEGQNWRRRE